MSRIIFDCDLMRFRNTGLYYYCLNLGLHINNILEREGSELMKFYVPQGEEKTFGKNGIVEKAFHKYVRPFLWDCRLWHAPFQSGRIVPQNPATKILLTIHDLNALHEEIPVEERKKNIAHTQKLIHRSDAIVCVSEFCRNDVFMHCDVKTKPVYVIHNGLNEVQIPRLKRNSYIPRYPFLLAMGDVNRKKNFHTLASLVEYTSFELVIVGRLAEADYVESIKKEAEEKNIEDRVHILGPVSEEEKAWYLKNCMAYVHPSLAEGFGLPAVEAMSFGKPLFLSNLTSLPEVGGKVAFYFKNFEPAHMSCVLLEGLKQYGKNGMAERIKEWGRQFDWRQKAGDYLNIYKTLLQ